jgi:heptose-I-phosphate ethanolaminephosphotransferase
VWHGGRLDGDLIPLLHDILSDGAQRRFIILHLLGSHAAYDLRYPPDFSRFGADTIEAQLRQSGMSGSAIRTYNEYDNSILYTDHVLGELISGIPKDANASLIYLSDHGEALGETSSFVGHIDGPAPRQVYQIPLLFYFSPSERAQLGERLGVLRQNLQRPIQSDTLIHTLLDIYGVDFPALKADRSLLSRSYRPPARYCDRLDESGRERRVASGQTSVPVTQKPDIEGLVIGVE